MLRPVVSPAVQPASAISYDNGDSGLTGTTAQDALDEVEGRVDEVEGRLDALEAPQTYLDTFASPGNVDLTATPSVRRGRAALAAAATSFVVTHPRLTADAYVTAQLEGSVARQFSATYGAGSVTLLTSTNTAIAINWYIHRFGDEG